MQWLRTVRNGGKLYWKPKSTTDCSVREEEEEEEEEVYGMVGTCSEGFKKSHPKEVSVLTHKEKGMSKKKHIPFVKQISAHNDSFLSDSHQFITASLHEFRMKSERRQNRKTNACQTSLY
jgi:hypothetical protein